MSHIPFFGIVPWSVPWSVPGVPHVESWVPKQPLGGFKVPRKPPRRVPAGNPWPGLPLVPGYLGVSSGPNQPKGAMVESRVDPNLCQMGGMGSRFGLSGSDRGSDRRGLGGWPWGSRLSWDKVGRGLSRAGGGRPTNVKKKPKVLGSPVTPYPS